MTKKLAFLQSKNQNGFSIIETTIVTAIIGVLAAISLPQLFPSQRLVRMAAVSRTLFTELRFARQQALSQQTPISLVYEDDKKLVRIYGGTFGARNAASNKVVNLAGNGLNASEIIYQIPTGCPISRLPDGAERSILANGNVVVITFSPDGAVRDPSNNALANYALYLYNSNYPKESSIAVSVLGSSGRVKMWRCPSNGGDYVE